MIYIWKIKLKKIFKYKIQRNYKIIYKIINNNIKKKMMMIYIYKIQLKNK